MTAGKCFTFQSLFFCLCFFHIFFIFNDFILFFLFLYSSFFIDSDDSCSISRKGTRINWGRYPHREKMAKAISDWLKKEEDVLDMKGNPITSKAMCASQVGICWNFFYKYINPNKEKR